MTMPKLDRESPSLAPHGDVIRTPGEKGMDVPAEPGRPTPAPTNPDLPGGPPEPVDPGKPPTLRK